MALSKSFFLKYSCISGREEREGEREREGGGGGGGGKESAPINVVLWK